MKLRHSFRNMLPVAALATIVFTLAPPSAQAAVLTWSNPGTWDDGSTSNWGTVSGGPYNASAWVGGSGALFEGTAGTVTVSGTINSVNDISFSTDGYTVDAGTLKLTGTGGKINAAAGETINSMIIGTVGLTKNGPGTLILGGANGYTGVTTVNTGVLMLNNAGGVPGGIGTTGGTSALTFNNGVIGLGVSDFTRSLAAAGTVTGVTFTNSGGWAAYGADRAVNLGGASASVTWATGSTGFNGKTVILGAYTATHTIDFQNPLDLTNGGRTIQVDDGAAAIDGKLSGNITGIASGNLTKIGVGTLMLSGTNNYIGTTAVSAGTLRVNGIHSGTGAVAVSAGATLGGTGSVAGAVNVNTGGSIGLGNGAIGTLSLGNNLTFNGTAALPNNAYFELGNGGAGTDKVVVTGKNSAPNANGMLVHLNQLSGGVVNPGTYTLIQGGATSVFTGCSLATTRAGHNLYSAFGAVGTDLQVTVAAGTAGDAIDSLYWLGDTTDWNTTQWYSNVGATTAAASPGYNSNVRFAATTPSNLANFLGDDYEINSLTVDLGIAATSISGNMLTIDATNANNNAAGNGITVNNVDGTTIASKVGLAGSQTWTVGTDASLTVSGVVSDFGGRYTLTKAGAGTLTVTGVNSYSGTTAISGGVFKIGGAGMLNSGNAANIVNNGTLQYSSSANQTVLGVISGSGTVVKDTSNSTLNLFGANTFTGGTTVSAGTLSIAGVFAGGSEYPLGTGPVTITSGATLAFGRNDALYNTINVNNGIITSGNSFSTNLFGPINLIGDLTLNITGGLSIASNISGVGGITKTGNTIVALTGNNTYTGPTTINVGTLKFKSSLYSNDPLQWTPANITVASGARLTLNVGGAGEFTVAQAGTLFANIATGVNNNGLKAGSFIGVDTSNAGAGVVTYSNTISDSTGTGGGAVGFTHYGAGTLELTGPNTYTGLTVVDSNGTLRVSSFNSVNGGIALLTSSSLGAPTTIANGTIWLGSNITFQGGNLTYTGLTGETTDRVIALAGANGTTYRLDQSGGGLLKFTSAIVQGLDNRGPKTFALQGSTTGTGEIAAPIPNLNAAVGSETKLTKAGTGTWTLSAANLYAGGTTVTGGALVLTNALSLPGGIALTGGTGNLTFNGGVIGLGAGDFTRSLNTTATITAATFTGNGGWAAYGADRAVNLGGASAMITWATANTGFNSKVLILGNVTATHTVNLQNPIDLGTATRTVQVDDGAAATDGTLSGALTGVGGGALTKTGAGTLKLTNTANSYSGATTVSAGKLVMGATNVLPDTAVSLGNATLDAGIFSDTVGTLAVTGTATINLGSAAAKLVFADSSAVSWPGTLNLTGTFVSGASLRFGDGSGTGLTPTQLGLISATGFGSFALDSNGFLTASAAGGYSAWQSANGTLQTIDLDHDNDGVSNGVEYFLGGNTNTTGFTPLPGVTNTGGVFSVTWIKATTGYSGVYGTDFWVETSTTLAPGSWTSATTSGTPNIPDTVNISGNNVTYTFPAGPMTKFARLKVTGP